MIWGLAYTVQKQLEMQEQVICKMLFEPDDTEKIRNYLQLGLLCHQQD